MEGLEDDLHREARRRNTLEMDFISMKDGTGSNINMEAEVLYRHF